MTKYINIFLTILVLISCHGCLPGMGDWDITLYEQKIQGTSLALYKYDAWGGRDSHKAGYAILDTTTNLTIQGIKSFHLDYLIEIPNKNFIHVANVDDIPFKEMKKMSNIYTPIKFKKTEFKGIKIKTKYYQEKGYRETDRRLLQYQFSGFKETRDSICFYGLNDIKSMHKAAHKDSLKIKKGYVIMRQKENKEVIAIEIKNLILSKDGNDSLILNSRYDLTPKNTIKSTSFSDYGIFKEKIISSDDKPN